MVALTQKRSGAILRCLDLIAAFCFHQDSIYRVSIGRLEEIAEFIGTTRETVTRTLSDFKTRHLVALQGSTLSISNRPALAVIGGA
jgi:hypothetical protein